MKILFKNMPINLPGDDIIKDKDVENQFIDMLKDVPAFVFCADDDSSVYYEGKFETIEVDSSGYTLSGSGSIKLNKKK